MLFKDRNMPCNKKESKKLSKCNSKIHLKLTKMGTAQKTHLMDKTKHIITNKTLEVRTKDTIKLHNLKQRLNIVLKCKRRQLERHLVNNKCKKHYPKETNFSNTMSK